uniref:Uncharacterized protein n=1 Tax=Arundo donax TaxID=35708 RepID=A0A0A9CVF2_ARUDO
MSLHKTKSFRSYKQFQFPHVTIQFFRLELYQLFCIISSCQNF